MSSQEQKIIALFDFDKTITARDTLLPFIRHSRGRLRLLRALSGNGLSFARYLIGSTSRHDLKENMLSAAYTGVGYPTFVAWCRQFSNEVVPRFVKPKALERLRWHQRHGHRCYLVSAAIEDYLTPWAAAQRFDAVIASKVEVDGQGRLTGRLLGHNCWGPEKVHRLRRHLGPAFDSAYVYAYGDSAGDLAMLQRADAAFFRAL